MRTRLVTLVLTAFVAAALVFEASAVWASAQETLPQPNTDTARSSRRNAKARATTDADATTTVAQESQNSNSAQNTNTRRRGRGRRGTRRTTPPATETTTPTPEQPTTEATPATEATPQQGTRRGRRGSRGARAGGRMRHAGVPTGVQNCIDHLIEMAGQGMAYEGHPEQIINNGLLWNDPQSKCSIGADADLRGKVFRVANAWRMKDMTTVTTLLQEIKSAAPQG